MSCLIAVATIFCQCLLIDEVYVQRGGEWLAQSHHSKKVLSIPSPGANIWSLHILHVNLKPQGLLASTSSVKTSTVLFNFSRNGPD